MARRILITAATGTIGGATMRLLAQGPDLATPYVIGGARSEGSAALLQAQGFASVPLDYDRPETLRPALEGVDAVFLITGYTVHMLIHAKRLLDAAHAAGVRHIVHLGALAADDTPHAHFGWHQLTERAIGAMGFTFTHLHPNFFMDTVWAGLRHRPDRLVHFIGDRVVSWIAADDIAAVAAAALRDPAAHHGQSYPLAVEALSLHGVAALLTQATGTQVDYRPRPATDLPAALTRQGMEPCYAAGLAAAVTAIEAGRLPLVDAVYDTVSRVTGRPPITWQAFIARRLAADGTILQGQQA